MTSHKEQPAVDTSAEIAETLKAIAEGYPVSVSNDRWIVVENPKFRPDNGEDPKLVIDTYSLRSLAAHPAEPEGMELETTAEERRSAAHGPSGTTFLMRLLRDFERMRARAEKAEATNADLQISLQSRQAEVEVLNQSVVSLEATLATYQQPVGDEDTRRLLRELRHNRTFDYPRYMERAADLIETLLAQLRDAQARGKEMEEALTAIDAMRYVNRGTVTPDNAFVQFGVLNKQACEVYDIARAAISRPEGSASK